MAKTKDTWIRIRPRAGSWHKLRTWTRVPGQALTKCGMTAHPGEVAKSKLEQGDRMCQRCEKIP